MKVKNKLLNYFKNFKLEGNILLSTLFGGSLIGLIIWNRLLRIRLPRDLVPVDLNYLTVLIGSLMFLYISLFLYYLLKWYQIIPREKSRIGVYLNTLDNYIRNIPVLNEIIRIIHVIMQQHVILGPHRIYDKIFTKNVTIAFYTHKFNDLVGFLLNKYLWVLPKTSWALILFYIILFVIPRLIPAIIFCMEIIYCQHLHYFYKSLILLILPLLMNILLFTMKNSAEKRMNHVRKFYKIEQKIIGSAADVLIEKRLEVSLEEYNGFIALYETEENLCAKWISYQVLYNIVCQIELQIERYKYYLKIPCYSLFALGFIFYFMILRGIYDNIIVINTIVVIQTLLLQITLFQIITLSLCLSFIIIRVFFLQYIKRFYNYLYIYINIKRFYNIANSFLINVSLSSNQCLYYYIILFGIPYLLPFILFVSGNIYYFYVSIYLLLIPLITNLFIYIVKHHAKSCIDYFEKFFLIERDPKPNVDVMRIIYKYLEKPEDIAESNDLEPRFVIDSWLDYNKTINTYHIIENLIRKYNIKLMYIMLFILLTILIL